MKWLNEQSKKKIIIGLVIILIIAILFCVIKFNYKTQNFGNNINIKNKDSIVNNILNMKSYEADVTINVKSNKNENTYEIKQENVGENEYKQIIKMPNSAQGMEIIFKENKLEVKNTKLNLSKIYENYKYIAENALILTSFVKEYQAGNETNIQEDEEQIILNVKLKNEQNKYTKYKTLYINKKTGKPTKMEIKDITQNVRVYILYNEIKINSLQETK